MRVERLLGAIAFVGACGGDSVTADGGADGQDLPDALPAPTLALALDRDPTTSPSPIRVEATLARGGAPVVGAEVMVVVSGGTASPVSDRGDGGYQTVVTPERATGEVTIQVAALGLTVERTAVVLAELEDRWKQPERVPGLVNTAGYEDSAEISPDGEWLIVSSYSPVDFICCFLGCGGGAMLDPAAAACNASLGPVAAPERPDLPGGDRVLSATTIHDELPRLGIDLPEGEDFAIALPPVAAYGFHRQSDGSFAEPFAIAFVADGMPTAPFGFTFAAAPSGTAAELVFAWDDVLTAGGTPEDTGNDLWRQELTLGARVVLGTFTAGPGGPALDRYPSRLRLPDPAGPQGNPFAGEDGVWFDSEGGAEDLFFAGGSAGGALASPVEVAVSREDRQEIQPYLFEDRLYFAVDAARIVSSGRAAGGDPASAATWSEERVELAAAPGSAGVGAIVAIGEPSCSVREGTTTLYFVYARKTSTGYDLGIGRVDAR